MFKYSFSTEVCNFTFKFPVIYLFYYFICLKENDESFFIHPLLQEGQISEAESLKLNLEQAQRERRVQMEEIGQNHIPKWFIKENNANWTFNGNYWDQRQEPGFSNLDLIELW